MPDRALPQTQVAIYRRLQLQFVRRSVRSNSHLAAERGEGAAIHISARSVKAFVALPREIKGEEKGVCYARLLRSPAELH